MKPTRKRGMKPLHIFFFIFGTCAIFFFAEVLKPVYPSPPSSGEGFVPVSAGNASAEPITVRIKSESGKVYQINIPSCSTCKTIIPATPDQKKCTADTVYKKFALSPGTYQVEVSNGNVFSTTNVYRTKWVVKADDAGSGECFFNTVGDNGQRW